MKFKIKIYKHTRRDGISFYTAYWIKWFGLISRSLDGNSFCEYIVCKYESRETLFKDLNIAIDRKVEKITKKRNSKIVKTETQIEIIER